MCHPLGAVVRLRCPREEVDRHGFDCDRESGARHTRSRRGIGAGLTCPLCHAHRVVQESVLAGGPSRECIFTQYDFGRDKPEVPAEWGAF